MFCQNGTSYLICESRIDTFTNCIDIGVNNLKLHYEATSIIKKELNGRVVILLGRFIDSSDPEVEEEQIAECLVKSEDVGTMIEKSRGLAGRFVILYATGGCLFILPDAIASIPVTYTTENELFIASNPKFIADIVGWSESAISKEIKSKAAPTHPLPYDLTMYDQMKKVPPNHFFDCESRRAVRYYPVKRETSLPAEYVAQLSSTLLKNIVIGYHKRFRLSLPLTSGVDSRTILALCRDFMDDIPTYTFFHHHFSERTADVVIPQEIAGKFDFEHLVLRHTDMPLEALAKCQDKLGSMINPSELQNVWTYFVSGLSGYTRLDGGVSTLARSDFGRDLPESLATSSYLVTKTHNYSKENRRQVKRWNSDIQVYAEESCISKFDLFYWEHRMGNWSANSYLNSDLLISSLNIFNCRTVIENWLRVPRRDRMNGQINKKIIKLNWPELLEIPFNPDDKYRLFYKSRLAYYSAVRGKYLLERFKYE